MSDVKINSKLVDPNIACSLKCWCTKVLVEEIKYILPKMIADLCIDFIIHKTEKSQSFHKRIIYGSRDVS
jgi:hypothetical protein